MNFPTFSILPPTHMHQHHFLQYLQPQPGIDTTIAEFCKLYGLKDPILQKFIQHAYLQSHMLCVIQIPEIPEMNFFD
jgi:hypothetical protein